MTEMLEDLDLDDDITLLSHRHQDIQDKKQPAGIFGSKKCLKVNESKTKLMKINTIADGPIIMQGTKI